NLTSGGSIANLIAVVTARDAAGLQSTAFEKAVIYTTGQVHHCADKSFHVAGMKDAVIRRVPMDGRFRIRPEALQSQIRRDRDQGLNPFLIFASAGTTDVGAVDPMQPLAEIAEKEQIWSHVDAAYGGAFLLTDYGKDLMKGIHRADSVIIDPHKGFFLPYGSGAVLVKDGQKLYDSQHMTASYLQDTFDATEEPSPADLSPELSKHFRGLRMWLPLQLFGIAPFRAALEEKLELTRYFYREIQKLDRIEVGPEPELSVAFFRYLPESGDPDTFNRQLVNEIHQDGQVFLSSTTLNGNFYIRMAVLNFRSHLDTVELALKVIRDKINKLREQQPD
ncbi:MAG: pyridoxal-dependent decarboxylase, partial [Balneolaceae bacterium]|nr:pyridoxal-dependent decarboxylase [Balneolaceae bacterium]